jgi:membrane-associated HD superfamily phosphohydrolase
MNSIIYKNLNDVAILQNTTYLLAFIAALIALAIAFVIANFVAYEGGLTPRDHVKRTWAYWLVGIITTASFFVYNYFLVSPKVSIAFKPDFEKTIYVATLAVLVVYILLGLIFRQLFKKSKFGTIKFKP